MQSYLDSILNQIADLQCIIVCDRDGVILVKSLKQQPIDLSNRKPVPLLALFSQCCEQASKLRRGKNRAITCSFHNHKVVQQKFSSINLTLIGGKDLNLGQVFSSLDLFSKNIEELTEIVL